MNDLSQYSLEQLSKMGDVAFSEYYKLAIRPCVNPNPVDLAPLEQATAKYEAIQEELEKRFI